MPHICLRCKTRLEASPGLAPRCPSCGGTKFAFESVRKEEDRSGVEPEPSTQVPEVQVTEKATAIHTCDNKKQVPGDEGPLTTESVESIRIIEPGKYDLNLLRLAASDDRVIQVGKDGNYRLDLHSMIRSQKKH